MYPNKIYLFIIPLFIPGALFGQSTITVSGAGTGAVNGNYTYDGTTNGRPYFTMGIYRIEYRDGGFGLEWEIWDTAEANPDNEILYFHPSSTATIPPADGWDVETGSLPSPSLSAPDVSVEFADGSGYTPSDAVPGTNNNPIGRFQLTGEISGASLTAAAIQLSGERSNITAVKLWSSADNTFNAGSDIQLDTQPDGGSVSFSGLNSAISASGTYYFVTVDLASNATGLAEGIIANNSSLTISSGTLSGSISNAPLSSESATLPVELTSFTAALSGKAVHLKWETSSEVNNYGFEVERKAAPLDPPQRGTSETTAWELAGFVKGSGNSNSVKEYSFVDKEAKPGTYLYRLKQIDNDGSFEYSVTVEASFMKPYMFELAQNYPNPFNPETIIQFSLPKAAHVNLNVYNILGEHILTLVSEFKEAGNHSVNFLSTGLPSGTYIYKIAADEFFDSKKLTVIK